MQGVHFLIVIVIAVIGYIVTCSAVNKCSNRLEDPFLEEDNEEDLDTDTTD